MLKKILFLTLFGHALFASAQKEAQASIKQNMFNQDGLYKLVLGYLDNYDQENNTKEPISIYPSQEKTSIGRIYDVAYSPDNCFIAAKEGGKIVDPQTKKELLLDIGDNPDARKLRTIKIFDRKTGKLMHCLCRMQKKHLITTKTADGHNLATFDGSELQALAYSPNGKYLTSISGSGDVKVWNAINYSPEPVAELNLRAQAQAATTQVGPFLWELAFSLDNKYLIVAKKQENLLIIYQNQARQIDKNFDNN
jgi:WD40 repeat protein